MYYQFFVHINGQESVLIDDSVMASSGNRLFNVNNASMAKYWYWPARYRQISEYNLSVLDRLVKCGIGASLVFNHISTL